MTFNRLFKFLTNEELDKDAVLFEPVTPVAGNLATRIEIKNSTFKWSLKSDSDVSSIKNINLKCRDGELVSIIGSVGSGKSSIINAILGEMYKVKGDIVIRGSISYIPQNAWIMNATVRENILFGKRYEKEFYDQVIDVCGLKLDLDMLEGGDLTEIGERGINLSGGQVYALNFRNNAFR